MSPTNCVGRTFEIMYVRDGPPCRLRLPDSLHVQIGMVNEKPIAKTVQPIAIRGKRKDIRLTVVPALDESREVHDVPIDIAGDRIVRLDLALAGVPGTRKLRPGLYQHNRALEAIQMGEDPSARNACEGLILDHERDLGLGASCGARLSQEDVDLAVVTVLPANRVLSHRK